MPELYAAAFWLTDAAREAGRWGTAGASADAVATAEEPCAGGVEMEAAVVVGSVVGRAADATVAAAPGRSQGLGGDAIVR